MDSTIPQLVVLNTRNDLLYLERLVMERSIIDPRLTPHFILTEYILRLLTGADETEARRQTIQNFMIPDNPNDPSAIIKDGRYYAALKACVEAISSSPYEFLINHEPRIQYGPLWYLHNTYLYYMVFSNDLDRQTQVYENDHRLEPIINRLYIIEPSHFLPQHIGAQIAQHGRLRVVKDFTALANELFYTDALTHLEDYRYLALSEEQCSALCESLYNYVLRHLPSVPQSEHLALLRHVCFELLGQRSPYPTVVMYDSRDDRSVAHASALVY